MEPTDFDDAIHGYGARLEVKQLGSPEDYVPIAYLTSITPGKMSTGTIKRTNLLSPEAHEQKMPGIRDTGPFGFDGNFVPKDETQGSGTDGLLGIWTARGVRDFRVVLADGSPESAFVFVGWISALNVGKMENDKAIPFSGEITVTEAPTLP